MFVYDIDESRLTWDDMIRFYGDPAILRMPGKGDRFCSTMQASFTPEERLGRISNPADRKMLISSLDPFTVRRAVRWAECDPAGVVYLGNYPHYLLSATHLFDQPLPFESRKDTVQSAPTRVTQV